MIACGWCGRATSNAERCTSCGHPDPPRPWVQRGQLPPEVPDHEAGRPPLDPAEIAHRLAAARSALGSRTATVEALADVLDVSPRTVRRWQKVAG